MTTIKEYYVSFEIAKLLKEKGFNCGTQYCYYNDETLSYNLDGSRYYNADRLSAISAPTQQMALAWMRDKGFYINVCSVLTAAGWVACWEGFHENGTKFWSGGDSYSTIKEATDIALKYCLKNFFSDVKRGIVQF